MFFPPPRQKRCPYCNGNLNTNPYCQAQDEYDGFGESLSPLEYRNICGETLRATEQTVLERYGKGANFEIGCGQFHRTETFYLKNNLEFYGIDPLIHIVQEGQHAERTLIGFFPKDFEPAHYVDKDIQLAHGFGGILNGAICKGFQDQFWMGLELLGQYCKTLAFDSLLHFSALEFDYENSIEGKYLQAFETAPPQYFPSQKELLQRIHDHNLYIVETIDDQLPMALRRIFVLRHLSHQQRGTVSTSSEIRL